MILTNNFQFLLNKLPLSSILSAAIGGLVGAITGGLISFLILRYQLKAQSKNQRIFYLDKYRLDHLNEARYQFIELKRLADDLVLAYDETNNERVKLSGDARNLEQIIRFHLIASDIKLNNEYFKTLQNQVQKYVESVIIGKDLGRKKLQLARKEIEQEIDQLALIVSKHRNSMLDKVYNNNH